MKTNEAAKKAVEGQEAEGARERIFKSAEELFIERGFDGVSINDVAVRAEVAKVSSRTGPQGVRKGIVTGSRSRTT